MLLSIESILADNPENENKYLNFQNKYAPDNVNIELVFDSNFGETVTRYEKEENKFKIINQSEKFLYIQEFTQDENGVYLTDSQQDIDIFWFITSSATVKYLTPALQVPKPLEKDHEWKWSGYQDIDGDTVSLDISGKVIGEEVLELPAGQFETLHIELIVELQDGERSTVNQWFADGLGTVKLHALIEDPGIVGLAMKIFGFDEVYFDLKEIRHVSK
jgi:hypothetical protein